ncbi:AAA family ATPase [Moritella viscosa]|uniref:AAA family ATPase n=1 Tax=Moritella viscosa TaxID=80854 RepID=UPI00091CED95|nr:ATP-binding protein [Moritella viscosa]SHO08919.1 AAA ATPase [Moritella viscosa]
MNGKLIFRIINSALNGQLDQVKMLTNILSNEISKTHPDLSQELARLTSSNRGLRNVEKRVNPNVINHNHLDGNQLDGNQLDLVKKNPSQILKKKPIWPKDIDIAIKQVLSEHENSAKLLKGGLEPIKTIIFTGPPGVGKTISAQWIAQEMKVPLLVLDLATVMSSQLGQTGNNLKAVIDYAASKPCVLLLDEFDTIAKKRNDDSDVGELKRLVTVLLQTIDSWPSSSLLIAATNHPELLDPAVWRRFEEKITFDLPDDEQIKHYLEELTKNKKITSLYPFFRGMSHCDIKTSILRNKKISLINEIDIFEQLLNAYMSPVIVEKMNVKEKKELAIALVSSKLSQRKVAELLNISRQTVKKALIDAAN